MPPGPRTDRGIQGQLLDWRRFISDVYLECYLNEVETLREVTPEVPITTNLMGSFKPLDYFAWAPHLDVISWDSYPSRTMLPADIAFQHDFDAQPKVWTAIPANGADTKSGAMEGAKSTEATRHNAIAKLSGGGAWRRRDHVLPMATVAWIEREILRSSH